MQLLILLFCSEAGMYSSVVQAERQLLCEPDLFIIIG